MITFTGLMFYYYIHKSKPEINRNIYYKDEEDQEEKIGIK